ncbi:MAG: type IX secretion system sortase PorU [Bacteroidota bacterium]|nr:type IX secretion system sortase PorU [Bacteroidota bacterium]
MRKLNLIILFCLMIAPASLFAQQTELNWHAPQAEVLFPDEKSYSLTFEGYRLVDEFGLLPVYTRKIPLRSEGCTVELKLKEKQYIPSSLADPAYVLSHELIGSEPQTSYTILKSPEGVFLYVYVMPVRINDESGRLELLSRFRLDVNVDPDPAYSVTRSANSPASESVLHKGNWIKIRLADYGIHKITYEDLKAAGSDLQAVDPETIQLFGNGNGMLPERNNVDRMDDLAENAIFVATGNDGVFNAGDYILFYGQGATQWIYNPFKKIYEHKTNLYDDHTYYYMTYGQETGKRIESLPASGLTPNYESNAFADHKLYEEDLHNLLKTGKLWLGKSLKDENQLNLDFGAEQVIKDHTANMNISYTVRTPNESYLEVGVNGNQLDEIKLPTVHLGSSQYSLSETKIYSFSPVTDDVEIQLSFTPYDNTSNLWIDYVELNLKCSLAFGGGQLNFSDPASIGTNKITEFVIDNAPDELVVWEVTKPLDIVAHETYTEEGTVRFVLPTDTIRKFVAWDGTDFREAEILGQLPNQNLHAHQPANLIIVSHPLFKDQAAQLGELHLNYDGLSYVLATTDQIYNEFSSGKQDPSAIRDYVRMLYDRASEGDKPRYLMLFGDGSYDPKDRDVGLYPNFIAAYQSNESLKVTYSFVTDDFYALMDPTEGFDAIGSPDLGVGRIPVNTVEQAQLAVEKISAYVVSGKENTGNWRNEIYFIADDEDGNTHVNQAEKLAAIIDTGNRQFHVSKIYLDAYQQVSLPGGDRYPEVNEAIDEAVRKGALVFNYTGHGGELGLAIEKVLNIPTVNSWDNLGRLPVFITATCEFSRFDNQEFESAGELVFLNPDGGGIALFTTTRLSYSSTNFTLNKRFYQNTFDSIHGEMPRLGDIIRLSKEVSNNFIKNFVLLGDPAMKLAYPADRVIATSIEVMDAEGADTLRALSKVKVTGLLADAGGNQLHTFNGFIEPRVFDKFTNYSTLGNDNNSSPMSYKVMDKCLYKGKVSVKEGAFAFEFVVPKDIDYSFGKGKIQYYAVDTATYADANGYHEFVIGGLNENAATDNEGPVLEMYINHSNFKSGEQVGYDPVLIAEISDKHGINFFGNGIGHDISLIIDNDPERSYIINDYFTPSIDDHTSGTLMFPLLNLEEGSHSLSMRVWDVYNNSTTKSLDFVIGTGTAPGSEISNYPNPFNDHTLFKISMADYDGSLDYELKIFSLHGRLMNEFSGTIEESSGLAELYWDGTGRGGELLDNGTYVYTLKLTDRDGNKRIHSNKLVIIK